MRDDHPSVTGEDKKKESFSKFSLYVKLMGKSSEPSDFPSGRGRGWGGGHTHIHEDNTFN